MVVVFLIPDKKSQVSFKIAVSYARQASVLQGVLEWCLGSFDVIHLRLQHVNHVRTNNVILFAVHIYFVWGWTSVLFMYLIAAGPKLSKDCGRST